MDSASALARFKARNSFSVAKSASPSAFILECKLKKILKHELTPEVIARNGLTESKVNQFAPKLEKLQGGNLKFLYDKYEIEGINGLLNYLVMPLSKLQRFGQDRRKNEEDQFTVF